MKKGMIQVCVFMMCLTTAQAAVKKVFFAGGQSNATAAWGAAIESGLQAEYGPDMVMVHFNHSGNPMSAWFTTGPEGNYTNDFFNTSGTGMLQAEIAAITNAGDEVDFKGFFWFQGESDTGSLEATATMDAYSGRFLGMMAQLKADLAMTNDIDFTLAIIDYNPDKVADLASSGRTAEGVDYLRAIQMTMSTGTHQAYVDTRGYTRGDLWHLDPADERVRLAAAMSTTHVFAFGNPETVDIFSDDADGCVYDTNYFDAIEQLCGYIGGHPYNGISFFQLPSNLVDSASISLTVVDYHGAITNANIDLWGLGYMKPPQMTKDWLLMDDTDTRVLLNYAAPTKIGDNIVTNGQSMPIGTVWQTDPNQQASLVDYINGLFEQGAAPGDYVVFRTNPDAPLTYDCGLRWGSANQPTNKRAKLTVMLSDEEVISSLITVTSHTKDGCIYDTGKFESNDLICGYTGGHPYNGIAFFELPTNRIETANIHLTVALNYGPLTSANIDVWGLGYMSDPSMDHSWQLMADTDTRSLVNDNVTFTKIADDFIPSGETTPAGSMDQLGVDDSTNLVAFLNSLFDKGAQPGDYAVIRVNPDAWFTDNQNVRWADEKNSGTRATMTMTLTDEAAIPPPVDDITIYSHENDGTIFGEGPGSFTEQKLICGTAGDPNTRPWNGVSFFQLPTNRVTSANLIFQVQSTAGSWSTTGSGIDVWGLGFINGTPVMNPSWLVMDNTDTRELLNGIAPTKLADNLVAAGSSPAVDDVYMLSTGQRSGLVDYINALFDMGAQPGDYAVIRINPDVDIETGGVNIYFGSSAETSPDQRAALTVTLSDDPAVLPPTSGTLYSHENDGTIYGETAGYFDHIQLICGTAGTPNTRPWNGISFFQLPHKRISEADLTYTVYQASSRWAATGSAIDVWGLGFISGTPVMNPSAWLLMGDTDTRTLLNDSTPSKIADNLVAAGSSPAVDDVYQLNTSQKVNFVDFLNGLFDKGAQPGDYAVIRINPDVDIETGGVSLYFGSSSDVNPDRRSGLTYTLSDAYPSYGLYQHYSQANDGGVYGSGANSTWDLDSSTGGGPTFDISGIAFFALPEQPMTSVSLSMVAESVRGVLDDANLDMWGLGYMPAPALNKDWLCISNTETRTFLNELSPVKLMDDFVTNGQTVAAGSTYTSTEAQSTAITEYLNGLYRKGAKPGDFAVIRINMDATQALLTTGVRWGGSHRTAPDHRAYISGLIRSSTNYLANGSLESGVGAAADNWTLAENGHNGERIYASSRSGTRAYKMSANGTTGTDESMYIAQDVSSPDFAGRQVTLSGYASHSAEDPMVTGSGQKVYFRLFWVGGSQNGGMVDSSDAQDLLPTDVYDEYKPIYVSTTAPEDITGIKVVIIFDTGTTADPSITTGSCIVDDLRLTIFQPIPSNATLIMLL